jgi:hypothetical protein
MNIDDGGAAFPRSFHPDYKYGESESVASGMTLRDYFAARIAPALISVFAREDISPTHCAVMSYEMADAMIAERNKRR